MHDITPWLKGTGTAALFAWALGEWVAELRTERRPRKPPKASRADGPIPGTNPWPDGITHRLRA